MTQAQLNNKIKELLLNRKLQVSTFIDFLLSKTKKEKKKPARKYKSAEKLANLKQIN